MCVDVWITTAGPDDNVPAEVHANMNVVFLLNKLWMCECQAGMCENKELRWVVAKYN